MLLTFDVEDWFQVENFKDWIPFASWENQESRVVQSTHRILDLLDTVRQPSSSLGNTAIDLGRPGALAVKATFFVLGWIAERFPELVVEIQARGHEIASHGYGHALANQMEGDALAMDLYRSKVILEDIIGAEVSGYRAPSFSISDAVLNQIREAGYRYDSSFNNFAYHGRYGTCDACQKAARRRGIAIDIAPGFCEIPISNFKWVGATIPLGGGGYFRLMPFPLYREGVRRIIAREHAYMMYLHPWEFDPMQPRDSAAPWAYRFRHTVNLSRTLPRLRRLIESFASCEFLTCREYLACVSPAIISAPETCTPVLADQ
jgi:polysaccharide deacetylase family protein (PEP-CTERM system associated)